jgi:ankyrin repeat protein
MQGPLHIACQKGFLDIIKFLLDNGADINKEGKDKMTPLHDAISHKQLSACELILKYEQVSIQNVKSGIELSSEYPLIQSLLENTLKERKRVTRRAQKICNFCKEVPQKRFKCGQCGVSIYCSVVCRVL